MRYNDPTDSMASRHYLYGYQDGVDRVMWFLQDWDGEGQLTRDIQEAIRDGVI